MFREDSLNTLLYKFHFLVQASRCCSVPETFMPLVWKQLLLRDIHNAGEMVSLQTKGLQGNRSQGEQVCANAGNGKTKEGQQLQEAAKPEDFSKPGHFEKGKFKSFSFLSFLRALGPILAFYMAPQSWSSG